jgi:hypothetical protein
LRLLRNSNFMRLKYLILCFLLFTFHFSLLAQLGGTSTYDFLQLPMSARTSALGGNFMAIRDADLGIAAINPSVLDSNLNNHATINYIPYFDGIDYGYVAISHTVKNVGFLGQSGTWDAGIKYIDYGTFTQADYVGAVTGTFTAGEYQFNLGYGQPMKDSTISAGATLKGIYSHLQQYYSWGMALDLAGTYVSKNRRFCVAAVLQNIGTQVKDYTTGNPEPLPFNAVVGITEKLAHAPFRVGVTFDHLQKFDISYLDPTDTETVNPLTQQVVKTSALGTFADKVMRHITPNIEFVLGKNFMIRFAYNYEMRKELELTSRQGLVGFSGGFCIKIYKFQLNCALAGYNLGGVISTFSMNMALSDFYYTRKT